MNTCAQLRNCPFCNHKAEFGISSSANGFTYVYVNCSLCGVQTRALKTIDKEYYSIDERNAEVWLEDKAIERVAEWWNVRSVGE